MRKKSEFDHIVKIEFSKLYNAGRVLKGAFLLPFFSDLANFAVAKFAADSDKIAL